MNRYKITATRSNGTELSDYFVEATEGAARKAFKECYRNEEYSDVKVELVAEYVQATKEQEREALAKIVKIIEGLGPGSYVGIAFEGCFKDAEDNIENDFGCSMKQKLESAEARLADAEGRLKELGGLIAKPSRRSSRSRASRSGFGLTSTPSPPRTAPPPGSGWRRAPRLWRKRRTSPGTSPSRGRWSPIARRRSGASVASVCASILRE